MFKNACRFIWTTATNIILNVIYDCKKSTVLETTLCLICGFLTLLLIPLLFIVVCVLLSILSYLFVHWCLSSMAGHLFILLLVAIITISYLIARKMHS